MRIGLLQTHALGDIIIALPIAQYFCRLGHEVFWPVDSAYIKIFEEVKSSELLTFLPVDRVKYGFLSFEYFVSYPLALLNAQNCEKTFSLYSALGQVGESLVNSHYRNSLKFDEYKYAITGVPFDEKWNISLPRDRSKEERLLNILNPKRSFVLLHETAGDGEVTRINIPEYISDSYEVINIRLLSDSIFDWIGVYEKASGLFLIDSAHSNLVEQIDVGSNRHLALRSSILFTPVYKNSWTFL